MIRTFNYTFNRKTKFRTSITLIFVIIVAVALYKLYMGGFFSAWFVSLIAALMALMVLSIPRRIVLLDDKLEIQCLSDITEIDIREIASVRPAGKREMSRMFPVFGAAGFFGYYGKYFDFKEFETVTIYASEWRNFVEITDIYDSRTYVSCREAERLTALVEQARAALAQENPAADGDTHDGE